MNCKITIVKVKTKGGCHWAQKAILIGEKEPRYRSYYYKKDAVNGLSEWSNYPDMYRNFWHNFNSAEELGLKEI